MATNLNFVVVYFLDSNLRIPTISKGTPRPGAVSDIFLINLSLGLATEPLKP